MIKVEYIRNIAGSYGRHYKGERSCVSEQVCDELCELNLAIIVERQKAVAKSPENKAILSTPENKVIHAYIKSGEALDVENINDKNALEEYASIKGIALDKRRSLDNMKVDFLKALNENNN